MKVSVEETISASKEKVWQIITDIDGTEQVLSAVKNIEVIERPQSGLKGLKWKETREMFGKEAVETMWVSEVKEGEWYEVTAESRGVKYRTRMQVQEDNEQTLLRMDFSGEPQTFGAKLVTILSKLFESATRKALQQDLQDIKATAENKA